MLKGFPAIAAAVVINRKKPIWVNRENAMHPFSLPTSDVQPPHAHVPALPVPTERSGQGNSTES